MPIRYYLHSDKVESKQDSYFCAFCDMFTTSDHFTENSHSGGHRQRLALTKKSLDNLMRANPSKFYRPRLAENLVENWPKKSKPAQGRFYRWLMRQTDRDDPIGDLAEDVKRDTSYPMERDSLKAIRFYLTCRCACEEVLQALEEAWSEFNSKGNSRSGISLKTRFEVFRLSNYTCQICGVTVMDGVKLEVDHKVPVAKGGSSDISNLWVLCFNCNRGKGANDL